MTHRAVQFAGRDGLPQSFLLVLISDVVVAVADFYRGAVAANRPRDVAARDPGVAEAALGVDLRGGCASTAAARRRRRRRDVLSRLRLISTRRQYGLDLQVRGLDLPIWRLWLDLHELQATT